MGEGWNKDNITNEVMGFKKANVITNSTSAPPRPALSPVTALYRTSQMIIAQLPGCTIQHYIGTQHCTTSLHYTALPQIKHAQLLTFNLIDVYFR